MVTVDCLDAAQLVSKLPPTNTAAIQGYVVIRDNAVSLNVTYWHNQRLLKAANPILPSTSGTCLSFEFEFSSLMTSACKQ